MESSLESQSLLVDSSSKLSSSLVSPPELDRDWKGELERERDRERDRDWEWEWEWEPDEGEGGVPDCEGGDYFLTNQRTNQTK